MELKKQVFGVYVCMYVNVYEGEERERQRQKQKWVKCLKG